MRLPGERFASRADRVAWDASHGSTLFCRAVAEAAWPAVGSCAPCRRAARFAEGRCDCPDRLDEASRALLHAAAEAGLCGWSWLRVSELAGAVAERLAAQAGTLVAAGAPAEVAILGRLPRAPAAAAALERARRGLVPGGCLLAPVGLDDAAQPDWDVLEVARMAGFDRAEMLRPWSRELGYRGRLFILKAVA